VLSHALLAAGLVSILSFSGALALVFRQKTLEKVLIFLVAFSAGTMMAGAFFHLLPEAIAAFGVESTMPFFLLITGFAVFFILERFVFWHHCHATESCAVHSFGYMNLVGDGIHNFLDGVVIAAAFLTDTQIGIVTTLAIISHEIPQEIGDFGVLVHAGMKPLRALFFNFCSAVLAILGVLVGSILSARVEYFEPFFTRFCCRRLYVYCGQ